MNSLSAFLNPVRPENAKIVVSKRFIDPETGKAAEWEVKTITAEEEETIRRSCTKNIPIPGKKNQYMEKTDQSLYVEKLAVACTVHPNLNSAELQDYYEALGAEQLLLKMLLPGEYADFLIKIQEITGFDVSMEEEIDEAKN